MPRMIYVRTNVGILLRVTVGETRVVRLVKYPLLRHQHAPLRRTPCVPMIYPARLNRNRPLEPKWMYTYLHVG